MSTSNNNPKGILLILIGMAIFSIQDALIKFVFEDTALYELYFGRTLTAFVLLLLYLKITNQKLILKAHYPYLMLLNYWSTKSQMSMKKMKNLMNKVMKMKRAYLMI